MAACGFLIDPDRGISIGRQAFNDSILCHGYGVSSSSGSSTSGTSSSRETTTL